MIAPVDPQRLSLFSAEEAVDMFRDLLWGEAWRQGVNILDVNVPSNITAADGGVDADVNATPTVQGLIAKGSTRYQIKTGAFSASTYGDLKDLFCKPKSTDLKERVKYCFENDGTFVAVLFGSDNPDTTEDATITKCKEFLGEHHPNAKDPRIRIMRANQIAGCISLHVALALRAQGIMGAGFRTHREWSSQSDMSVPIQYGAAQNGLRDEIQKRLRGRNAAVHVCLVGEPGAGKTRLVLEATRSDDLAPMVAYCASPEECARSGLVDALIHDTRLHAILVVDDCEARDAQTLWNTLQRQGGRVGIVTLQHENPGVGGATFVLAVPPLDDNQVLGIIQAYVPGNQGQGFVHVCSGSPRVAHVIGANLQRYPNDLLKAPDTVDVWGRYISGNDDPKSEVVRERHTILQYCALFKKFGCKQPVADELRGITALIQKDHPAITMAKVQVALRGLQGRRILQGDTTLYITPKALHIKLWGEWWEVYGDLVDFAALLSELPETLRGWFMEMFRYARESAVAGRIVDELLGPNGPFVTTSILDSARGAEVFSVLAEANPESALACLERVLGELSIDDLRAATENRRHLVWSLQRIAVWRALFGRAALLLERLALAENEPRISNNATGVFLDLFSLGPGEVAPTEAPPAERFPILEAMIKDSDAGVRALGIQACHTALRYGQFMRLGGTEYQGLRVPPDLWMPKTYGEWHAAYGQVWTLLRRELPALPHEEQEAAGEALIDSSYLLGHVPSLAGTVIATLGEIARLGVKRRRLLEHVHLVLEHIDKVPEPERAAWKALLQDLSGGDDFAARLQRCVGMASWRYHLKHDQEMAAAVDELAKEAAGDPSLLAGVLPWLYSRDAENAYGFGYRVGVHDDQVSLWPLLRDAAIGVQVIENVGVLAGYLRGVAEHSEAAWLKYLTSCSQDKKLRVFLPDLLFQGKVNDASSALLTPLVRDGIVPLLTLRRFAYGSELRNLSEPAFNQWRELLVAADAGPECVGVAVELVHAYYRGNPGERALPVRDIVALLTDERLFWQAKPTPGSIAGEAWYELAKASLQEEPTAFEPLATIVLDHLGDQSVVLDYIGMSGPIRWLDETAREHPAMAWGLASARLGPPIDRRAFHLGHWIRGDQHLFEARPVTNILDTVPRDDLWAWVDADVGCRAGYFASLVPPTLDPRGLAREVLIRYGDRREVKIGLRGNFNTEGWSGLASEHHTKKRSDLQIALDRESEPRVRAWITEYLSHIDQQIQNARISEEREDF